MSSTCFISVQILRRHVVQSKSIWMSFDCGLSGMTKYHHNSLDNDQAILYSSKPMWVRVCVYMQVSVCACVCVLINNTRAECEIWQAWRGLCGLPLHSNKTETCWQGCQMSEGVCWEPSSVTIWMIVVWKGWQHSTSIFQYPSTDGKTPARGRLLSMWLKCQTNVT